jgi:uncharacterized protein YdiU (UPF0061 family)
VERATEVLGAFDGWFEAALRSGQRAKLGLGGNAGADAVDSIDRLGREDAAGQAAAALADDWLALLQRQRVDVTQAWRFLADAAEATDAAMAAPPRLRALFEEPAALQAWLARWREQWTHWPMEPAARAAALRRANPWIIARNHRVEEALAAASGQGDLGPFERLLQALRRPFEERLDNQPLAEPAPAEVTARYRTFCGT